MSRLTKRYNNEIARNTDGIECSNYCTNCGRADCDYIRKALLKLARYEDLEEQGRLIVLPCKPHELVWEAHMNYPTRQVMYCCNGHIIESMESGRGIGYTKEEAEARLKEMEGEQE